MKAKTEIPKASEPMWMLWNAEYGYWLTGTINRVQPLSHDASRIPVQVRIVPVKARKRK